MQLGDTLKVEYLRFLEATERRKMRNVVVSPKRLGTEGQIVLQATLYSILLALGQSTAFPVE